MTGRLLRAAALIALGSTAAPATAQIAPVGAPRGILRIELSGAMESWDRRYRDGDLEPYAADLSTAAFGSTQLPALIASEAQIAALTGDPTFRMNLGTASARSLVTRGVGFAGLAYGVSSGVTIFGRIPLVQGRVQTNLRFDPAGANVGANPASSAIGDPTAAAGVVAFFDQFGSALTQLDAQIASGAYDGDPALRALADATRASGGELEAALTGLIADPATASDLLPTTSAAAGATLAQRVVTLQSTLTNQLGVAGFTAAAPLPGVPVTAEQIETLLAAPRTPFGGRIDDNSVTHRGDAELGAAVTLIDRWNRGTRRGGIRLAVEGVVRLPTGFRDRTDHPIDVGTGDGQTDIEAVGTLDLGAGGIGARIVGGVTRQRSTTIDRRVAAASEPFASATRLARVEWDPGDVTRLAVSPFLRLARHVALQIGVERRWRSEDRFEYADADDAIPGVDADVLSSGSSTLTSVAAGLTYSLPVRTVAGRRRLPIDASLFYSRVTGSGEGVVPAVEAVQAQLRLYWDLF